MDSGTTILGMVFDSISIVGFFIISAIIITRFLKVIQFIPLNLLFFGKTSNLWDVPDIF